MIRGPHHLLSQPCLWFFVMRMWPFSDAHCIGLEQMQMHIGVSHQNMVFVMRMWLFLDAHCLEPNLAWTRIFEKVSKPVLLKLKNKDVSRNFLYRSFSGFAERVIKRHVSSERLDSLVGHVFFKRRIFQKTYFFKVYFWQAYFSKVYFSKAYFSKVYFVGIWWMRDWETCEHCSLSSERLIGGFTGSSPAEAQSRWRWRWWWSLERVIIRQFFLKA